MQQEPHQVCQGDEESIFGNGVYGLVIGLKETINELHKRDLNIFKS